MTCPSCGTLALEGARFCHGCGSPVGAPEAAAEYKQVTVLFADVVHSMGIAAAVGAERLREIMAQLLDRCTAVVRRYGGTVDKFTGDGVMAVFGAPIALEDHAFRACLAALEIQSVTAGLATEVARRDGITLQLRVGVNSGQVIAGEVGSGAAGYTAIGEQVGMAQRMESAAPPGGVMLSESTARLVESAVVLGEPELVAIKGSDTAMPARRLLATGPDQQPRRRAESNLIGRTWELNTLTGIFDEVINGAGCVVNIMGPPGIGKSRLVREAAAVAAARGVPVYSAYCESHAGDIPFHAIARLMRSGLDITGFDDATARDRVRDLFADADADDLLLLHDLLGIRDPAATLPDLGPDARRRRLTALINAAALARREPAVYVTEDVHWIDESSEALLTGFLEVIPRTPSLVLITYRPEYRGALAQISGAQTVALRPLSQAHAGALTAELLGGDPSLGDLAAQLADRAAGNPFFTEELVRDLAEREVLHGKPGGYRLHGNAADVEVPATLQAVIGARIDRLDPAAKHTLNAAAVIGARFHTEQVAALIDEIAVTPLIEAQLIDQVSFTARDEFVFRHPLIRAVAYESQLKSTRAQLHIRLAGAIEHGEPDAVEENAALIAEHCEAAGDLHAAFGWHMRAAAWSQFRDMTAAHTSWRRAQRVADRLPEDDPGRTAMRIAPRTMLCGTATFLGGSGADTGFDELRELCEATADHRSLAIGMVGVVFHHLLNSRCREAFHLGTELVGLLDAIGDPTLMVALAIAPMTAMDEVGEVSELLRLAQRVIDLADGDPAKGNLITSSPLTCAIAYRGGARCALGLSGWRDDFRRAMAMARPFDPLLRAAAMMIVSRITTLSGVLLPDETALRESAEILAIAEQSGEDQALDLARLGRGYLLARRDGADRQVGLDLLAPVRERGLSQRFSLTTVPADDVILARERARLGDLDGAVELARSAFDSYVATGSRPGHAEGTAVLVEALLSRGGDGDLERAQDVIDRFAAIPTVPGYVLHDIALLRLRALLARGRGDQATYREFADRYRDMATTLEFDGHMALAEAMP